MSENVSDVKKSEIPKLVLLAVIFAAALLACDPVSRLLSRLTTVLDWTVPFRLVMLVSGLTLAAGVLRLLFRRWAPKSSRARTAFTISNSALRYILGLLGLLWALAIVGVDVQALLAGAGVVALIIGFGAESLIADVITGIFMLFEHQYEVGDIIVVGSFRGTVTQIGIRTTSITDTGGNVQIINNSDIRNLINRSNDNSFAVCDIGIPYQGWLHKAEGVLAETLPKLHEEQSELFTQAPKYLGVQQMDISNDAVILRVSAEVAERNIFAAQRALNRALLLAFEDAGIPNPVAELKMVRE